MSALAGLMRGEMVPVMIAGAGAGAASGLAAYLGLPAEKKVSALEIPMQFHSPLTRA